MNDKEIECPKSYEHDIIYSPVKKNQNDNILNITITFKILCPILFRRFYVKCLAHSLFGNLTVVVALMFRKRKKEKLPFPIHYQIVGHSGIRDGAVLKPNEKFKRSWTVMNSNLNSSPASKDKGRTVKLVHRGGLKLKDQILFLWPAPGKLVTVRILENCKLSNPWSVLTSS